MTAPQTLFIKPLKIFFQYWKFQNKMKKQILFKFLKWHIYKLKIIIIQDLSSQYTMRCTNKFVQWRKWGHTLGAIALPSIKKIALLKGISKQNCYLYFPSIQILPLYWKMLLCVNFVKNVYRSCLTHNELFKYNNCSIAIYCGSFVSLS